MQSFVQLCISNWKRVEPVQRNMLCGDSDDAVNIG